MESEGRRVEKEEFGVESGEQESGERRLYIRVGRREWRVEKVWWRKESFKGNEELKKEK